MQDYLNKKRLLYDLQSGFRQSHSTETCLVYLTDSIRKEIDSGKLCGLVLLDLQKAFDTVNHAILLSKLRAIGMSKSAVTWFSSYLSERIQRVEVNRSLSDPQLITCGVPQGSVLGPLLFLLYINDMPSACSCKLLLFADDAALLVSHRDQTTLENILGRELEGVSIWLSDNRLSLHLGKTEAVLLGSEPKLAKARDFSVQLGPVTLTQKKTVKYLGCILDENVDGEAMASQVLGKVNSRTRFLARYTSLLDRDSLRLLANGLVLCHLDYGSVAWFEGLSKKTKGKLQVAQNKLVRVVLGLGPRSHIGRHELQELNWLPVESRVTQLRLSIVHNSIHQKFPSYLQNYFTPVRESHSHLTRASVADLREASFHNNTGQYSFTITGAKNWNSLPTTIKQIPCLPNFKNHVRQWLREKIEI